MSTGEGAPPFPWLRRLLSGGRTVIVEESGRATRHRFLRASGRSVPGRRGDRSRPAHDSRHLRRRREPERRPVEADLGTRLVAKLRECGPDFVLSVAVHILAREGYKGPSGHSMTLGVGHAAVHGVIWYDPEDDNPLFLQVHRVGAGRSVGPEAVESLLTVMRAQPTTMGCVITTGRFTPEARAYAAAVDGRATVLLVDQQMLGDLMVAHRVGVRSSLTWDVDGAFFDAG